MNNKKLIVLVGPTAVGKTGVAMRLARHWATEIVSADSRQIFREMEIGTAKPTQGQMKDIRHYFINTQSVHDDYNAGQYGHGALEKINELFEHSDKVILCGGSGLYIKAVCEGLDDMPEISAGIRENIIRDYSERGLCWLQEEVKKNDPEYFAVVDQQNPQRLMRALELYRASGSAMATLRKKKMVRHRFEIIKIGLTLEREILYQRIDERVDEMMRSGLEEETRNLRALQNLNALQTVGYAEMFGYLNGE
jgi:tRNA dimethylallyltransferase